jgi:MYXO-CTERM domain-containing protein
VPQHPTIPRSKSTTKTKHKNMKHKHRMILPLAMIASLTLASSASAALAIVNGNFETTTGYTPGGNADWRDGIATGWSGPTPAQPYAYFFDGSGYVANLGWASSIDPTFAPLYQDIGTLDGTSSITLTFDFVTFTTSPLGVAIYNGASFDTVLGSTTYAAFDSGSKSITVNNVAGGAGIRIAFWQGDSPATTAAGLDNVAVSVTAIPEPSAALLGGLGMLALLRRRR